MNDQFISDKSTSSGQYVADTNGILKKDQGDPGSSQSVTKPINASTDPKSQESQNHSQSKRNQKGPTTSTPKKESLIKINSSDRNPADISALNSDFEKCSINSDSDSNNSYIDYNTGKFLNHIVICTIEIIQINKPF